MSILYTKDYEFFKVLPEDIEILGASRAGRSLPGDNVVLNEDGTECIFVKRAAHPLLPGILNLTSKYMYGMTARGVPLYLFRPHNRAYPPFIVASAEKDRTQNILVLVKFEFWEVSSKFPRGVIQEVLGLTGNLAAEKLALMWRYSPYRYNSKTPVEDLINITDLEREELSGYIFNIDPPGCKDIDDVININYDTEEIGITIADVSEYIDKLDPDAFKRGATLYQDGRAVRPMLPANLSEDLCSLIPGELRLGLTLFIHFNGNKRWAKTILVNKTSYTYDDNFPDFIKDCLGDLSKSDDPHKWIEWAMLEYNKEAGKILKGLQEGILRRHSGPKENELNKWANCNLDPSILQCIAVQSAEYCLASEPNSDHFMIGANAYAHASSPLRRYCDLVNQRIIKGDMATVGQDVVDWLNIRQKELKAHDRDLCFLEAVAKNEDGATVEGIILDEGRIFVKEWRRIIKCRHLHPHLHLHQLHPGQSAQIRWFVDWSQSQWKNRLVFSVS